ncbi:hypothetical protein, partial [Pseudomonas canadensis]|uniref:hypothetical protein n=1 Tax=Pseudomonas canadensis TaxID=915099 RepID=UPI0030D7FC11
AETGRHIGKNTCHHLGYGFMAADCAGRLEYCCIRVVDLVDCSEPDDVVTLVPDALDARVQQIDFWRFRHNFLPR